MNVFPVQMQSQKVNGMSGDTSVIKFSW